MKKNNKFKPGDFVSVWTRQSKRHKWRLEFGYILLTRIHDKTLSFQNNETHVRKFWTTADINGEGTWERKLDKPIFDVKINKKSIC